MHGLYVGTVLQCLSAGKAVSFILYFVSVGMLNSTNIITVSYADLSVLYTWKIIFHVFDLLSFVRYVGRLYVVCVCSLFCFLKKKMKSLKYKIEKGINVLVIFI